MYLSKVLLIFHFPHILPPVLYHMVIIFLYAVRFFSWISEAELLPFYKEEDKIQKGKREDKDPINSCSVNRQTGTAERESPLKKVIYSFNDNYLYFSEYLSSSTLNRHLISKKGEHSNIQCIRE